MVLQYHPHHHVNLEVVDGGLARPGYRSGKSVKAEGFDKWEETDDAAKKRIKQAYRYAKGLGYQKVGLSKIKNKTIDLLEKKQPINPRTGLPYTQEEFIDLTPGQKTKHPRS